MNVMNSICARITPAPSSRADAQPMDVGPRAREAAGRAARGCARDVHANNAMPPAQTGGAHAGVAVQTVAEGERTSGVTSGATSGVAEGVSCAGSEGPERAPTTRRLAKGSERAQRAQPRPEGVPPKRDKKGPKGT